ncbi:MAG TPA: hypothetical protein VGM98_19480 [Schlesneria sp.]|jgi:hypothetical protein
MIEFIFILALLRDRDADSLAMRSPKSTLAQVATPEWGHATAASSDKPLNEPWPVPEKIAETVDGIPPSPAILSGQGFKNAASVFGAFFGGPLDAAVVPIDSRAAAPIESRNDPKDLSSVTTEIADVIARWEKSTIPSPKVFEFHRTTYDLSRQVETRATGFFQYVSPNDGTLRFADETSMSTPVSHRKNAQGKRFVYEASSSEEWRWSEREIFHINDTNKTYSIAPLPIVLNSEVNDHFRQTIEARAPFIIEVRSDVIRREWSFTLRQQDDKACILEAIPRTAARRRDFSKCLIRLDAKSGRLTAVKYVDADQVHETVYVIDRCRELKSQIEGCRFPSRTDRLKGYVSVPMPWQ